MSRLLEIRDYATAVRTFEAKALWELVDDTQGRLNHTDECIGRHPVNATALRISTPAAAAKRTPSARWRPRELLRTEGALGCLG